jgi:hypothetical protein
MIMAYNRYVRALAPHVPVIGLAGVWGNDSLLRFPGRVGSFHNGAALFLSSFLKQESGRIK